MKVSILVLLACLAAAPAGAHPQKPRSFTYTLTDVALGTVHVTSRGRPVSTFYFFAGESGLAKDNAQNEVPAAGAWYELGRPFAPLKTGAAKPSTISLDGLAGTGRWSVSVPGLGTASMKMTKAADGDVVESYGMGYWWASGDTTGRTDSHSWGFESVLTKPVRVKVTGTLGRYKLTNDDPRRVGTAHQVLMSPAAVVLSAADF